MVLGVGSALPERRVTNDELAETVDTTDAWIVERTGIRSRYVAGEGETTASLAAEASRRALDHAGAKATDIDLIVLATATPDQTFPSSATKVQAELGIDDCIAFDVHAVCTGFLYALTVADSMLRAGSAERALVIGAETFTRILDWEDRATCVLFGDGAGALVLGAEETESGIIERMQNDAHVQSAGREDKHLKKQPYDPDRQCGPPSLREVRQRKRTTKGRREPVAASGHRLRFEYTAVDGVKQATDVLAPVDAWQTGDGAARGRVAVRVSPGDRRSGA